MSGAICLVGGGGHAKVVAQAIRAFGVSIAGFIDDDAGALLPGLERIGDIETACEPWIMCVGDVPTRMRLLESRPGVAASVRHPSAMVSESVEPARGVFVGPGAIINPDATIEHHAIINTGAIVEHDARVGFGSHIAPSAVLCGAANVGRGCLVGAGAVLLPGVRIGDGAIVGAGAVVRSDVPPGAVAVGVPAAAVPAS